MPEIRVEGLPDDLMVSDLKLMGELLMVRGAAIHQLGMPPEAFTFYPYCDQMPDRPASVLITTPGLLDRTGRSEFVLTLFAQVMALTVVQVLETASNDYGQVHVYAQTKSHEGFYLWFNPQHGSHNDVLAALDQVRATKSRVDLEIAIARSNNWDDSAAIWEQFVEWLTTFEQSLVSESFRDD